MWSFSSCKMVLVRKKTVYWSSSWKSKTIAALHFTCINFGNTAIMSLFSKKFLIFLLVKSVKFRARQALEIKFFLKISRICRFNNFLQSILLKNVLKLKLICVKTSFLKVCIDQFFRNVLYIDIPVQYTWFFGIMLHKQRTENRSKSALPMSGANNFQRVTPEKDFEKFLIHITDEVCEGALLVFLKVFCIKKNYAQKGVSLFLIEFFWTREEALLVFLCICRPCYRLYFHALKCYAKEMLREKDNSLGF